MLSKLDLEPKCQGHNRNQKLMTWGTKNMPSKKNLRRGALVTGVTPTPTAVKQYVDPNPMGGVDINTPLQHAAPPKTAIL